MRQSIRKAGSNLGRAADFCRPFLDSARNSVANLGGGGNWVGYVRRQSDPPRSCRLSVNLCILFSACRLPRILFSPALFYSSSASCLVAGGGGITCCCLPLAHPRPPSFLLSVNVSPPSSLLANVRRNPLFLSPACAAVQLHHSCSK